MPRLDTMLERLLDADDDRLLDIARFAELGMSAGAVIHEIRQPLTALSLAVQLLQEQVAASSDTGIRERVDEVADYAHKAVMLLDRAKNFMQPSCGREPVRLRDVLETAKEMVGWRAARLRTVRVDIAVDPAIELEGDRIQLEHLFVNLLSNGIDAAAGAPGGGAVLGTASVRGDRVVAVVADTGLGIDPDVRSRLFQPFFSTKGASGSGLGLFIVARIARRHGARCVVWDAEALRAAGLDGFTTGFVVEFPRKEGE